MNKNKLLEVIENIEDVEVEKRIKTLHDYVPYRLLTPFYTKELASTKDIFKKNDNKRNKFIAGLTKEDERSIYKIDVDNKVIEINDFWYKYIRANQAIIYGWMHYKLICYLQKRNPNALNEKLTSVLTQAIATARVKSVFKHKFVVKRPKIGYNFYKIIIFQGF